MKKKRDILAFFKEIEGSLDSTIYLKRNPNKKSFADITQKEFIVKFLKNSFNTTEACRTVEVSPKYRGTIQCNAIRRSLGDIYLLSKYYYPRTTLAKTQLILCDLIDENRIGMCFCHDIRRRVYAGKNDWAVDYGNEVIFEEDEFGIGAQEIQELKNYKK